MLCDDTSAKNPKTTEGHTHSRMTLKMMSRLRWKILAMPNAKPRMIHNTPSLWSLLVLVVAAGREYCAAKAQVISYHCPYIEKFLDRNSSASVIVR